MSYKQAMYWAKKHPKGTKQVVIMSTGSGFWPSHSFLSEDYFPYIEQCKLDGIEPLECEAYYNSKLGRSIT